jgi:glycosyltransferase involved in cell wall biosynthesis
MDLSQVSRIFSRLAEGRRADCAVCILCPGSPEFAGGIGRSVANLLAQMSERHPSIAIRFVNTRGSRHIALSPLYFAYAVGQIALLRLVGRVTVIHANVASRGSTARKFLIVVFASLLRVPTVLHLHGGLFMDFYERLPGSLKMCVNWMFCRADRVVVLGSRTQQFVVDRLGVAPGKVAVIRNGVPGPPAKAPIRVQQGGVPKIVFAGRLGEHKGVGTLLDALASPLVIGHPWQATLAGDGNPGPYQAKAQRLGIASRVQFPGWLDRSRMTALLEHATLLVLPSRAEALPMAVLEALAHGLPVITTPVGALPDSLVHEKSVLFIEPGNVGALAAAIQRLITDEAFRSQVAQAGHEAFLREFDIAVIADQFAEIYRELTDHGPAPRRSRELAGRAA